MQSFFSAPLPFTKKGIEKLAEANNKHNSSKIKTLYGCLPSNSKDKTGLEQQRNSDSRLNDFRALFELVSYSRSFGFDFMYLMNEPDTPSLFWLQNNEEDLILKLTNLFKNGITKLRICNTFVIDFIHQRFPEFEIYLSTSQEYYSIKQFKNLFLRFPFIKGVVLSWDLNRNIKFINSFLALFPNIELELMVNEGCISGCPFRKDHHSFSRVFSNGNNKFFNNSCSMISNMDKPSYICLSNIIYPWWIKQYNSLGVYHFKFVGRNDVDFYDNEKYLAYYEKYMDGIENVDNVLSEKFVIFNNYILHYEKYRELKVCDIINLLPKFEYFIDHGHLCNNICGTECNYCLKCAESISKKLEEKLL